MNPHRIIFTRTALFLCVFFYLTPWAAAGEWISLDGSGVASGGTRAARRSTVESRSTRANHLELGINLPGMARQERVMGDGNTYSSITAPGAVSGEVGAPDIPVLSRLILIPNGTDLSLEVVPGKAMTFEGLDLPPVQPAPPDVAGAAEPPFARNDAIYSADAPYPGVFASVEQTKRIRGQEATILRLYPYQYNPSRKKLMVYPDLRVTVHFSGEPRPIPRRLRSGGYETMLRELAPNADAVIGAEEEESGRGAGAAEGFGGEDGCDLLIISYPDFEDAADTLAAWKRKAGFRTHVVTTDDTGTTASEIQTYIQNAYDSWSPAPAYVLFIGDAEFIPVHYETYHSYPGQGYIGTDLYYATVDGSDYFPDISTGRISVDTLSEANGRVEKIINYESAPVTDSAFYGTAAICAYFQHAGSGYAERRFAQTSEDLAIYLSDASYLGEYSVDRVYYTETSVTPLYWSTSWFGGGPAGGPGDPIPSYLLKPGFAWDGGSSDISSAINEGRFLLTHRDHGSATGWGEPYYHVSHVEALTNGDRLPVVWSVNCQTGWFDNETSTYGSHSTSFSEAWERNPNGGAIGVIAATRVSYSGHNDRLFWGWIDAIWQDFVSSYSGTAPFENPDYRMADVLNYGKLYYATTYTESTTRLYEFEMFHWFGDPTLRIRTRVPLTLSASHTPVVHIGAPTVVTVTVSAEGSPHEGACVTISRADVADDYWIGYTDANGEVTFPDLTAGVLGDYDIVATAFNCVPYEGAITCMAGSDGIVYLGAEIYACSSSMEITVCDSDIAGGGAQEVELTATGGDSETVVLGETGVDTGIFTGTISASSGDVQVADGTLQTSHGETITATYVDADDGQGGVNVSKTDDAAADCQAPGLSGAPLITATEESATITWTTDEPATCDVRYGTSPDDLNQLGDETALDTDHSVTLEGLSSGTRYYFEIVATDQVGHETAEDNGGAYYAFTTDELIGCATGFEDGELESGWTAESDTSYGRIQVTSSNGPRTGSYHLTMDVSSSGYYNTNDLTLLVDLSETASACDLSYWYKEWSDENHSQDGVSISNNGTSFTQVQSHNNGPSSYTQYTIDLDSAAAAAGLTLEEPLYIRWTQYDNFTISSDGIAIDDILIGGYQPVDTDGDGTPDNDDDDDDGDGLTDEEEVRDHATDPAAADTDSDGLDDGDEVNTHGTSPLSADTDNDCLSDYEEVVTYGSNPMSENSDGDGWCDVIEVAGGSDPNVYGWTALEMIIRVSFQPPGTARPVHYAPDSADGYRDNLGYGWQ